MFGRIGISDEEFIRGQVPMTKSEVRAVLMSKLKIQEGMNCLDVGCGTGSVTVEMAMAAGEQGHIIALDNNPEAIVLTKENVGKFGLKNVEIIQGKAPEVIPRKPYDRVFVGGGGRSVEGIIDFSSTQLKAGGILVVTSILIETLSSSLKAMEAKEFQNMGCVCLNVAVGEKLSGWMMKANNPIYIVWGERK